MTKPKTDQDDRTPTDAAEDEFNELVASVSPEAKVSVTLKRMPSYLHPQVTEPEDLPPPTFRGSLPEMTDEVRARYGPGKYRLYVRIRDPRTGKSRFTWPTLMLAPTPEELEAAERGPDPGPEGTILEARRKLANAAAVRAEAAELAALEAAAGAGQGEKSPATDPAASFRLAFEVLKGLLPQQTDPLTLLKTARDLIAPAKGGEPAGVVELVTALLDLSERVGGKGRGGALEVLVPHLVDLMKSWGPYLPAVARALARVPGEVRAAGPAGPGRAPTATPEAPSPETVAAATGGEDARKQAALHNLLNMAYLEMTDPNLGTDGASDAVRQDGYDRLMEYCLVRLPGFREDLLRLDPEQVWATWTALDPRVAALPTGRTWLDGFRAYLAAPPEEEGQA